MSGAIATFVAIAFALLCWRAAIAGPWLLLDADLGWHLGYGEWIATHLGLPEVDEWSFTKLGGQYQLTQWGGETLLGVANMLGGATGLLLLNCVVVGLTLGVMFATATGLVGRTLAAIVVGASGFMLFAGAVRPTMFSWLLAAVLTMIFIKAVRQTGRWVMLATAAVVAVWTNVHGSFALAAVTGTAFWVCMGIQKWREGRIPEVKQCAVAVLLVCAATLLNPYGWKVWSAVYTVATLETTQTRYFSDWKAPEILSGLALPAWMAMGALLTAVMRRQSWWMPVACVGVACLSLSAQRNAGLASVGACAVVCLALSESWLDKRLTTESAGWRSGGMAWHLVAAVMCLGSVAWLISGMSEERVASAQRSLYPLVCMQGLAPEVEAMGREGNSGVKLRVLNEFEHGGWWQRKSARILTAIDGRADLFGDQAFKDLETLKRAERGWQDILMNMAPDAVCLAKKAELFEETGFRKEFALASTDQHWALWVRRKAPVEAGTDSDRP